MTASNGDFILQSLLCIKAKNTIKVRLIQIYVNKSQLNVQLLSLILYLSVFYPY